MFCTMRLHHFSAMEYFHVSLRIDYSLQARIFGKMMSFFNDLENQFLSGWIKHFKRMSHENFKTNLISL